MKISLVIPCYNSESSIESVVKRIVGIFEEHHYHYEIILVNDCSRDNTWGVIKELSSQNKRVRGISLSKNSGQHTAIMAGFRQTDGDIVMTSDDDGQTPVENIPQLINLVLEDDVDVASAKYIGFEKKKVGRRIGTLLYKSIIRLTMEQPKGIELRVFMAAKRFVIDEVCKYDQPYTSINGLILRVTNRIGNVEMLQHPRESGQSGYSLKKLILTCLNAFTAFSVVPLRIATTIGLVSSGIGMIGLVITLVRKLLEPSIQMGWSSIIALILLMSGIILFVLGIIGEYVGRIYMSINKTPQYVIRDTTESIQKISDEEMFR